MNKRRIWPLELLRICSILIVFAFHAMTHLGTSFSIFSQYIANGATYMVVFFMLSGFVIFLGHENSDWSNSKLLAYFYLRRLISIYPLYLFLHFTYEIVFRPLSVKENLLILPVELLGLQSFFSSLFSVSHNGGTWFVSCLLFCYFLFPLFELIVRGLRSKRSCLILCLLLYIILAIAPVVNYVFKTNSLYENPFFRSLEFLLGVLLAKIATTERPPVKWPAFLALVLFILHIVILSWLSPHGYISPVDNSRYIQFDIINIPFFALIIYFLSFSHSSHLIRICQLPAVRYFSSIGLCFWFAQMFYFKIVQNLCALSGIPTTSGIAAAGAFVLCFCLASLFHFLVEKPAKKILFRIFHLV